MDSIDKHQTSGGLAVAADKKTALTLVGSNSPTYAEKKKVAEARKYQRLAEEALALE